MKHLLKSKCQKLFSFLLFFSLPLIWTGSTAFAEDIKVQFCGKYNIGSPFSSKWNGSLKLTLKFYRGSDLKKDKPIKELSIMPGKLHKIKCPGKCNFLVTQSGYDAKKYFGKSGALALYLYSVKFDHLKHINKDTKVNVFSFSFDLLSSGKCMSQEAYLKYKKPTPTHKAFRYFSDRRFDLVMNAWGSAKHGTYLRLHRLCPKANPDCRFIYKNGMLLSERNQKLAIMAWGGAKYGTYLRLSKDCKTSNPDCRWIFKNGMLLSARNQKLAINAMGGGKHGTFLRLHPACTAKNPDCTWKKK